MTGDPIRARPGFGFSVRHETIYRRTLKSSGQTGYLPAHTMAGWLFVKRADKISADGSCSVYCR